MYFFVTKFLVSDLPVTRQKFKFTKIPPKLVENRKNSPLGPFWGSDLKKIYKKSQLINRNIFRDRRFALKSKIKNFEKKGYPILSKILKSARKTKDFGEKIAHS